jgi:hypothetical protein
MATNTKEGFVMVTSDGLYISESLRQTHVGFKPSYSAVTNIGHATIYPSANSRAARAAEDEHGPLTAVPAYSERKVMIGERQPPAASAMPDVQQWQGRVHRSGGLVAPADYHEAEATRLATVAAHDAEFAKKLAEAEALGKKQAQVLLDKANAVRPLDNLEARLIHLFRYTPNVKENLITYMEEDRTGNWLNRVDVLKLIADAIKEAAK